MDKVTMILAATAALGAMALADPGTATADTLGHFVADAKEAPASVTAGCWSHLAGKQTHTTPAADRRFHLERGEPSPCTESDAAGGSSQAPAQQAKPSESKPNHDKKSRYCRKRWFC